MSKDIKSGKYTGVYYRELKNGDRSYYVMVTINGKDKRFFIGKRSEEITEHLASIKRNEILNKARFGEEALETLPFVRSKKKKHDPTLSELSALYINLKNISESTKTEYLTIMKYLDDDGIGSKTPSAISIDDIQALQQKLKNEGKAPSTVNKYIGFIKSVFNHGIRQGNIKNSNPATAVKSIKENNERQRYLSQEEAAILLEAVMKDHNLYLFCLISLQTGARLDSVLHIQAKDINLVNGSITLHNLKSQKTYTGFFTGELERRLREVSGKFSDPNDYLISFNDSRQATTRQIQCRLKPILDKLFNNGLNAKDNKNRVVIHTLRHTFASWLAIGGTDIFKIKKLMDHSSITETMRYAKLLPDSGKDSIESIFGKK